MFSYESFRTQIAEYPNFSTSDNPLLDAKNQLKFNMFSLLIYFVLTYYLLSVNKVVLNIKHLKKISTRLVFLEAPIISLEKTCIP